MIYEGGLEILPCPGRKSGWRVLYRGVEVATFLQRDHAEEYVQSLAGAIR